MSGLPTRTGDKKNSKAKISNTPIRIGEMGATRSTITNIQEMWDSVCYQLLFRSVE